MMQNLHRANTLIMPLDCSFSLGGLQEGKGIRPRYTNANIELNSENTKKINTYIGDNNSLYHSCIMAAKNWYIIMATIGTVT